RRAVLTGPRDGRRPGPGCVDGAGGGQPAVVEGRLELELVRRLLGLEVGARRRLLDGLAPLVFGDGHQAELEVLDGEHHRGELGGDGQRHTGAFLKGIGGAHGMRTSWVRSSSRRSLSSQRVTVSVDSTGRTSSGGRALWRWGWQPAKGPS